MAEPLNRDQPGAQEILLPARVLEAAQRTQPLLRGLIAAGAGFAARSAGRFRWRHPQAGEQALLIYCVRGRGWCETGGRLYTVGRGEVAVLPPGTPRACGAQAAEPWTIHWVHATGALLPEYLKALAGAAPSPVHPAGADLETGRLFNEIGGALRRGTSFGNLLRASHALGYLLALLVQRGRETPRENTDAVSKIAATIVYMSDHLAEPLRIPALARLAGLSPAYFSELFKEQTGCSPREYHHLLRIHRACQLLHDNRYNVKEIASRLGYQDPLHFSRRFKAFEGLSPSDYRLRARVER